VAKYKRPCFDSSVFLGGLNGEIVNGIKRNVVFEYLWDRAKAGDFKVMISALTLAEVYKTKRSAVAGSPVLDEFLEKIEEHFVEVIEIDRETGLEAHALCRRYASNKLYPGDAFHLACASRAGCDVLLAWDGPLGSIGTYKSVRIEEPTVLDRNLFTETEIATPEEIKEYDLKRRKAALDQAHGNAGSGMGKTAAKQAKTERPN
jgi:predicted nucleic acid-binding protein